MGGTTMFNPYKVIIDLAADFAHGWAGFVGDRKVPASHREWLAFADAISAEMVEWEAERSASKPYGAGWHPTDSAGLRPSLVHVTQTGRWEWALKDAHTTQPFVEVDICRPGGAVIRLRFDQQTPAGRIVSIRLKHVELRHVYAAATVLRAVTGSAGDPIEMVAGLPGFPGGVLGWEARDKWKAEVEAPEGATIL